MHAATKWPRKKKSNLTKKEMAIKKYVSDNVNKINNYGNSFDPSTIFPNTIIYLIFCDCMEEDLSFNGNLFGWYGVDDRELRDQDKTP